MKVEGTAYHNVWLKAISFTTVEKRLTSKVFLSTSAIFLDSHHSTPLQFTLIIT